MAKLKMILAPPSPKQIPADEGAVGDARILCDPGLYDHTKPLKLKLRVLGNGVVLFMASDVEWIMMTPQSARQLGKELQVMADKMANEVKWKRPLCHCGQPLHYTDPAIEELMMEMVEALGEFTRVTLGKRTWLVSRHYIALHGLKAKEIDTLRIS